jgi:phosphate transport system permease protein
MIKGLRKNPVDFVFGALTAVASLSVVVLIGGIFFSLLKESMPAIERFGIIRFISTVQWDPVTEVFGGLSALIGTLVTTFLSLVFAIPVAIGIAIFITEIAPDFLKGPIGTAVELLAAIPSIIYGMWGLFTLAPIMEERIEPLLQSTIGRLPLIGVLFQGSPMGIDLFTASVILSIMIIPFTASVARDSFRLTPEIVKESAYGVGATKWEVVRDVVLPYSKIGVFGGVVLSLGRAIGETMAVAFVLGNNHELPHSLFDTAATITVTLANEFTEADTDLYLSSLYYLALILFVLSFITLALAKFFLSRAERRQAR